MLQARFSMASGSDKNSSTLQEQEQKSAGIDNDLPAIDKRKERQLVRKFDLYIVPVVSLLYLFSFLDRCGVNSSSYRLNLSTNITTKSEHRQC